MNNMYNNAYNIIHKNEDKIPSDIEILNFEIFDRNKDNHIIKYNGEYKNDIVLLSGYDMFGCVLCVANFDQFDIVTWFIGEIQRYVIFIAIEGKFMNDVIFCVIQFDFISAIVYHFKHN